MGRLGVLPGLRAGPDHRRPVGDDRGRKKMLQIGTAGFVIMSAVIGFATDPNVLIGARFVQGLAAGLLNPQVSGIIQNVFPRSERRGRSQSWGAHRRRVRRRPGTRRRHPLRIRDAPRLADHVPHQCARRHRIIGSDPPVVADHSSHRDGAPARSARREPHRLRVAGGVVPRRRIRLESRLPAGLYLHPAAAFFALFVWWEAGPARRRGYPLIDLTLFRIRTFATAARSQSSTSAAWPPFRCCSRSSCSKA